MRKHDLHSEDTVAKARLPECDTLRQANLEVKLEEQGGTPRHINPRKSKHQIRTSTTKESSINLRTRVAE